MFADLCSLICDESNQATKAEKSAPRNDSVEPAPPRNGITAYPDPAASPKDGVTTCPGHRIHRVVDSNPSASRLTRTRSSDLIGRTCQWNHLSRTFVTDSDAPVGPDWGGADSRDRKCQWNHPSEKTPQGGGRGSPAAPPARDKRKACQLSSSCQTPRSLYRQHAQGHTHRVC